MIRKLANFFTTLVQKYLPDAYLFAIFLTFFVFLAGMIGERQTPMQMVGYWGDGFWKLLTFAMQMVLILVTGHTIAKTKVIHNGLVKLAGLPKNPTQAIIAVTLVATLGCWLNWGFGLIIGGLFAQQVARKVKKVHYGLLIASAYSGFLVWHAGLSGSIPLKVASAKDFMATIMNGESIPISETIFAPMNFMVVIVLFISLPILNALMAPKEEDVVEFEPPVEEQEDVVEIKTLADKLENSRTITFLIFALGLAYIVHHFFIKGGGMELDIVNFIFLTFGILLHGTPRRFLKAFNEAIRGTGGIVLQFPFYAGIMGMMVGSGLATSMSNFFVEISNVHTFPLFTYLSAGLVNFFVPSGGGQWAVQGPIIIPAAKALGVPVAKAAMAIAWGDAWTNMVQPFWALPLLAIAGLSVRAIMGFCVVTFLWSGIVTSLFLLFM